MFPTAQLSEHHASGTTVTYLPPNQFKPYVRDDHRRKQETHTPEQIISLNQWELQDGQGAIFISKL